MEFILVCARNVFELMGSDTYTRWDRVLDVVRSVGNIAIFPTLLTYVL